MNIDDRFQQMMKDFKDIATVVELFPSNLQERVFDELVGARREPDIAEGDSRNPVLGKKKTHAGEVIDELEGFYQRYNVSSSAYNDMQAGTVVAYYHTLAAPKDKILPEISDKEYLEMCEITGRPQPANAKGTLNNAKYHGYLVSEGRGRYSLSDKGKQFVEDTVLKEDK